MKTGLYVSAMIVGVLSSGQARAIPARDVEVDYFAERSLKTQVGTFTKPCGTGAAHLTGRRTRFYVRSSSSCLQGGSHAPTTISCHFTEAGCSDNLARRMPITSRTSSATTVPAAPSSDQPIRQTP